jgi:c-di-GMP-binding flagellar brake protein YcgR
MGLTVSLIILSVLVLIMMTLLIDERRHKPAKSSNGKLTGYWDGVERRASVRIKSVLKAKYCVHKKTDQKKATISKNISLGGILMQLSEKLFPATLLLIDIFLPSENSPITAKGEVVWIRELSHLDESGRRVFDAGIKFISMNQRDKERLDKHIKGLP